MSLKAGSTVRLPGFTPGSATLLQWANYLVYTSVFYKMVIVVIYLVELLGELH